MHDVGFTGTQKGVTTPQLQSLIRVFLGLKPKSAHHGVCIGADATFHHIAASAGVLICGHPPINQSKMAELDGFYDLMDADEYLARNDVIVAHATVLIATPKEFEEVVWPGRSGTWATYRRAVKAGIPRFIVFPDGSVKSEAA